MQPPQALIFCPHNRNRNARKIDEVDLCIALKQRKFGVRLFRNLTSDELRRKLNAVSKEKHLPSHSLWIFVLCLAWQGTIYIDDQAFDFESLCEYFSEDKCPSLIDTPKIFFTQVCKGSSIEFKSNDIPSQVFNSFGFELPSDIVSILKRQDIVLYRSSTTGSSSQTKQDSFKAFGKKEIIENPDKFLLAALPSMQEEESTSSKENIR